MNDDDFEPYLSGQTNQVTFFRNVVCFKRQFVSLSNVALL